ncbi:MAG: hypothetical protein CL608_34340 [Anaerolineaceae bacterium]|jgi:integrase|nr:hypothetical protein [Anaerolineaceae bacterium]
MGSRYRRQFSTRKAAEDWDLRTRAGFADGLVVPPTVKAAGPPPPTTLGELLSKTRQRYWQDAKSIKTIDANLKTLIDYMGEDLPLSSVTEDTIEEYTHHLEESGKLTPATINRKLAVLSRSLLYAQRRGWITQKIEIRRKKEGPGRVKFYTEEEILEIVKAFHVDLEMPEYALLFRFLCDTGLRLSEALDLEWEDTTDGRVTVWDHKGAKPGGVPATDKVAAILHKREETVGNLTGPWADMTVNTTRYAMKKLRAHFDKTGADGWLWHTCRHTFCSRLAQAGVPLPAIRDLARHQDINTTIRYSHLSPKDYESAINKLR